MAAPTLDSLREGITLLMEKEIERIVSEEATNAANRVVDRVRGMTGQIATRVASMVDYSMMRNELIITVKLPEKI